LQVKQNQIEISLPSQFDSLNTICRQIDNQAN
jgi:hypothetical protein